MNMVVNMFQRRLETMFPSYFGTGSRKHDHYKDFGWPEYLSFEQFHRMWKRNSVAKAGVEKTILKTWETLPTIWETEESGDTPLEKEIRQRFDDLRVWHRLAEADRRSMVGKYSAVILRYADNQNWDRPVTPSSGGLMSLVELIPVWETQLRVGKWVENIVSEDYGKPEYFEFHESAPGNNNTGKMHRTVRIHPDRVIIWSDDGSMDCSSALESGFNDLIDIEKIKGAGGEGFWKTSRGAPIIEAPEGVRPSDVARNMDVPVGELLDNINEQIDSFQKGFDKGLMLGGMSAKPLQISLPSPEPFFTAPVQSFAASLGIPLKVLMGSQTGERSSTEDAKEWGRTIMARRTNRILPLIRELIDRLERAGVLEEKDWVIDWPSLTESTPDEKMARAEKMSNINKNMPQQPAFEWSEIRETAGYDPDIDPPDALVEPGAGKAEDEDIEDIEQ